MRHLAEKMATNARTGIGLLTDDDVALLFLRYQVLLPEPETKLMSMPARRAQETQ
jgi:hypothetical protein